jgi:hypothetical protein
MENVKRALKLLMEDVGERWIKVALIDPKSDPYRGVAETTWTDLKSERLIHDANAGRILLSGHGSTLFRSPGNNRPVQ